MDRVLLLSMPFGALERPALGLSLLKPLLEGRGVGCEVGYLGFAFADLIGCEDYLWVSSELPYTAFAGDWMFGVGLYGERPEADAAYVREVLQGQWQLDATSIRRLLHLRDYVEPFLDHCLASVDWRRYGLVGFTSTFEQNLASLALAARIKARFPRLPIAFGGANWEDEMGWELHRRFAFVDYVCSGEAEESFPRLVEGVLGGNGFRPDAVRGLVFRRGGESVFTGRPGLTRDLDALPFPDFDDYFAALHASAAGNGVLPTLLFETSRGCWWGDKSHCTFCGLNGSSMVFRSKSQERALEEVEYLVDRWRLDRLEAVDNILDMRYFQSLLPALARRSRGVSFFYEVKANLSREQVRLLAAAGVRRIQPGIESLSDHVLALMRKGTTGLRNVQLLKWCREAGVRVDWNLLYGFPGETAEDYADCLELLRAIRFLEAPGACGPVRLDRFSPYHVDPQAFGFVNVRPMVPYRYLYPFEDASLRRIAYYFDFDYDASVDPRRVSEPVIRHVERWRRDPEPGELRARATGDGRLVLSDSRSDAVLPRLTLAGPERAAYEYCGELRTPAAVVRSLHRSFPDVEISPERVGAFLDSLVANRYMVSDGSHYLSLALTS